jgi:hypothetical protein
MHYGAKEAKGMQAKTLMVAALPLVLAAAASAQQISATVNGKPVHFEGQQPTMVNSRVMVPVRGVFEHMGAMVEWDPATRTVFADGNGKHVVLKINEPYATVDNRTVELDSPPLLVRGRTMVPLRFISESLGATVNWMSDQRLVAINTGASTGGGSAQPILDANRVSIQENTVIPFDLNTRLSSHESQRGDKFTATIDTNNMNEYEGLPEGTVLEGHVDTVRAKSGDTPGVLGLAFDQIRLPSGRTYAIDGSLIALDNKSIENRDGRLVARSSARNDDMKYVGIGAGAGVLIALATKGNILTNAIIGGALGYLYDQIQKKERQASNVVLNRGAEFGVMLNRDLTFVDESAR